MWSMDIPYGAWALLLAAFVVMIPVAFVAALVQVWKARERRDGKR